MALRTRCGLALALLGAGGLLAAGHAAGAPTPPRAPEYRGGRVAKLAAGRLLVATPALRGPFFQRSVVLLLEHSPDGGALGVVVNRPTELPLAQLLPEEPALAESAHRAWVGGPVGRDRVTVLFLAAGAPPVPVGESEPVVDGVRVGATPGVLRALAGSARGPRQWRAYVGYAGWAPGQLESEVARGSWAIEPGAARWIFAADPESVWLALVEAGEGLRTRRPPPWRGAQRWATTYAIQAGSSGACSRRVKMPLPSSLLESVPSQ